MKKRLISHVDAWHFQSNILVTREGQACLSDFGIASAFGGLLYHDHTSEAIRYMAPERLLNLQASLRIDGPSRASDAYSLAMTSFEVCFPIVNYPPI